MFEVEYFLNGWVKKDGVNSSLVLCNWPSFRYPIDCAFSPHLSAYIRFLVEAADNK